MVSPTLLAILSTLFTATAFAARPAVQTSFIKRTHVCTHAPANCAPGLICAGPASKKVCVIPKPPGMNCQIDPFWVCRSELSCEKNVCKIPVGGNCADSPNHCAKGTKCKGKGKKMKCKKVSAKLGKKCNISANNCADGLTCDGARCKLPKGRDCTATPSLCASGLSCDGKRANKRCITYKPAGMGCPANEDFWICASGLTCEGEVCKIPMGGKCSSSPANCVNGANCTGSGGKKKCTKVPAKLGETCDVNANNCASGLKCNDAKCKLPKGRDCTSTPLLCASGLSCDGKRASKRCITYKPAGTGCPANEDFWICAAGLKCESDVCKIPMGGKCSGSPANCASGLKCSGFGSRRTCRAARRGMGEKCDAMSKCAGRLLCDGTCKLRKFARCERMQNMCASRMACVGFRRKKWCLRLVREGRRCGMMGLRQCERHLVCARNRCVRGNVGMGGRCNRRVPCKAGLVCAGGGRHRKMCVKPMGVGQKCRTDPYWVCASGLRCSRFRCREN